MQVEEWLGGITRKGLLQDKNEKTSGWSHEMVCEEGWGCL